MKLLAKIFLTLAGGLLLIPVPGRADSITFDITTIGTSISASGTFTTDPLSAGSYQITSIAGTLNGQPMTLLPYGTYWGPSDNLLFAAGASLDYGGIAFTAGGNDYNLYDYRGNDYLCVVAPHTCGNTPAPPADYPAAFNWTDTTTSGIPESSALVLLGIGLLGVVGAASRKWLWRQVIAALEAESSIEAKYRGSAIRFTKQGYNNHRDIIASPRKHSS
jgi:hypothetical protein